MDEQGYLRLNLKDRAIEDQRRNVELDAALAAVAPKFREKATAAKAAYRVAADELVKSIGDEYYEPIRRADLEKATDLVDLWEKRASTAEGGKLLYRQDEMGDVGFTHEHKPLIHAAIQSDRAVWDET